MTKLYERAKIVCAEQWQKTDDILSEKLNDMSRERGRWRNKTKILDWERRVGLYEIVSEEVREQLRGTT